MLRISLVHTFADGGPWVESVAFSPDGQLLACTFDKRADSKRPGPQIAVWQLDSMRMVAGLSGHTSVPSGLVFDSAGTLLATCGEHDSWNDVREDWSTSHGEIRIWDVSAQRLLTSIDEHRERVKGVVFGPQSVLVAIFIVGILTLLTGYDSVDASHIGVKNKVRRTHRHHEPWHAMDRTLHARRAIRLS